MNSFSLCFLTFCCEVPKAASKTSGERLPGWIFKHWNDDVTKMNLINMPMDTSIVVRKMTKDVETDPSNPDKKSEESKTGGKKRVCPDENILHELSELGVKVDKKKMKVLADGDRPKPSRSEEAFEHAEAPLQSHEDSDGDGDDLFGAADFAPEGQKKTKSASACLLALLA